MNQNNYEDIINLPHHISSKHPQMSIEARSAQFTPFSALSGYDDAVKETERRTESRLEIDEESKNRLNNKLNIILNNIKHNPKITFTYFVYDQKKSGGKYITTTGKVKKVNIIEQYITLMDKTQIPINEIINMKGDIFSNIENE